VSSTCLVCTSTRLLPVLEIPRVPVFCNVHWPEREAALTAPAGRLDLVFCPDCGHLFNRDFHPELLDYDAAYDNCLHHSPRFREYADALARDLVARHDLQGRHVLEIACGKGDFLRQLLELGAARASGFDPSYEPPADGGEPEGLTIIREYYDETADVAADLLCCRHALEHFAEPVEFLRHVRRSLGDRLGTGVFFEVPNSLFTLRDLSIWDLIYEHVSYFSPPSLATAFRRTGFTVDRVAETFGNQFLTLEAHPTPADDKVSASRPPASEIAPIAALAESLGAAFQDLVTTWRRNLDDWLRAGKRVVVWGGGSKGVTYLNLLGTEETVAYVVDINPNKQGKYVAGSGQQYVSPEFLARYRPEVVVIMNPIYRQEIETQLAALGVAADVHTVV
jgi:SAM-dependent methyltransferase